MADRHGLAAATRAWAVAAAKRSAQCIPITRIVPAALGLGAARIVAAV
ncbi:MAG: hypothetical protein HQ483_18325 [Rhodospirillales bacterium]|nr:hypothetical protein [Rhodospirillales bacterium]